jgi:23S rRNA (uracil1939-C5)-methyltransferase
MNIELEIRELGYRGMGIGRHKGKVVMVPLTAPGERVEVRINRQRKSFDEAEVVRVLEPSPWRREPPCPYFGRCGGCQLQHLEISRQRDIKEGLFRRTLTHWGDVSPETVKGICSAPEDLEYRDRLEMHVHWADRPSLGFAARGSKRMISVNQCLLGQPPLNTLIPELCALLKKVISPEVLRVELSCGSSGDRNTIVLRASRRLTTSAREILTGLARDSKCIKGIYFGHRQGKTIQTLWEEDSDTRGVSYNVPVGRQGEQVAMVSWPGVFRQVNPSVNCLLVSEVLDWTPKDPSARILELYSGMGNLTIPLSYRAAEVVAVEVNPLAAKNAQANAESLGIENIRWMTKPAKVSLLELLNEKRHFDVVVLDPPREGARDALEGIAKLRPREIVYVSCDPATLARDIKELQQHGSYRPCHSQPLDMFPQTFHLESVTVLQRARD